MLKGRWKGVCIYLRLYLNIATKCRLSSSTTFGGEITC